MSRTQPEAVSAAGCTNGDQRSAVVSTIKASHNGVGSPSKCTPAQSRPLRALVIDDDRLAADKLSTLVELCGHQVRAAHDAASTLEAIAAFKPDVLLLDVNTSQIDGCRLVQRLRREMHCENTMLIAIARSADQVRRLIDERAGFDHCLVKPLDPSTLAQLLVLEYCRLATSPAGPHGIPQSVFGGGS